MKKVVIKKMNGNIIFSYISKNNSMCKTILKYIEVCKKRGKIADFREADFRWVNFSHADFSNANFRNANFIGVNFKHWGYICGLFCPICRINSHNCRSYNYGL